ncbi:uncharacterized protein LOC127534435 [Acanthochromis polyacanthus]|uniref:uncharacterized protein LOC127534435 n=1 Tax=Acanthochromis polyacanthus TaxID=80966 RepID=UPI00223481DE|nr:uncharacterized protein LOC127534435 [Acanthochromis polyacanthus]
MVRILIISLFTASTTSQPKSTLPTFPPSTFLPSVSTATTPTEESLSSTSGTSKPPSASSEDIRKQDSSSAFTATTPTEQSLSSTSGTSKPPSSSTESSEQLDSSPPRSDLQLYMGLILVVKIFILSMPLMIFCKKRRSTKPKGPVETIYINVSESSRVIEEIREDRQISSPPVETSSVQPSFKTET